jgi:hypothetical protein
MDKKTFLKVAAIIAALRLHIRYVFSADGMKINLIFVAMTLLLYNCSNHSQNNNEESIPLDSTSRVIKIKVPSIDNITDLLFKRIDLEPYIEDFKFVVLDFTDESVIGAIDKVEIFEEKIYIMDMQTSSLFVFDINGKYLFKIHNIGQGPQDYIHLDFFDIDKKNRHLVLTDLMAYWIIRFDMDGNFISKQKIPFWIEGITPLVGGYCFYANFRNNREKFEQEYNLILLDSTLSIQKEYLPYNSTVYDNPRLKHGRYGIFYYYNDSCRFYSTQLSTLYSISMNDVAIKFKFDFGKYTFDYNMMFDKDNLQKYLKNGAFYQISTITENDDYLNFNFYSPANPMSLVGYYSKQTGNIFYSPGYSVGTDYFFGMPIGAFDSWFISEIDAPSIIKRKKEIERLGIEITNNWMAEKEKIANQITEEDNPVLVLYKLKIPQK